MHAQTDHFNADCFGIASDHRVDTIGGNAGAGLAATQGFEERDLAFFHVMPRNLQVGMDTLGRHRVQWQIAQLAALAMDLQVPDAAPLLDIPDHQLSGFLAAQAVVQQHSKNRTIAQTFEGVRIRRLEQGLCLVIPQRRRFSFVGFNPRPLYTMHGIAYSDRIILKQVMK